MTNRPTYATLKEAKKGAFKLAIERLGPCAVFTIAIATETIYGVSQSFLARIYEPGRIVWDTTA